MQQVLVPSPRPEVERRRTGVATIATAMLVLLVGVVYFAAARLGLLAIAQPENIAILWPASGIAAGALIAIRRPGCTAFTAAVTATIAAATFLANLAARGSVEAGAAFAVCNALECLAVSWIMVRLGGKSPPLESLQSVLALMLAAVVGSAIAAVPAAVALQGLGLSPASFPQLWIVWMRSDAIGIIVCAPVVIAVLSLMRDPPPLAASVEGLAGCAALAAGLAYAFGLLPKGADWPTVTPPVVAFAVLLWIGSRTTPQFSALAALVGSLMILLAALSGSGWYADNRLEAAQMAMLATSLCALTLAAVFARSRNLATTLQDSERRMSLALSAAGIYAFDYDLVRGQVLRMGGLADTLGLPGNGVVDDFVDLIHPQDCGKFVRLLKSLNSRQPEFAVTIRVRMRDGQHLTIQHRAEGVFSSRGRLLRIIGSCIDATPRQKSARAQQLELEAAEDRLMKVLAAARIYTFDSSFDGRRASRSKNALSILGLSGSDPNVPTRELLSGVQEDDRRSFAAGRKSLTPASTHHAGIVRYRRPDGATIWLEVIERATFDADGRIEGFSGLARDVTARVVAEKRQGFLTDELNHRVRNMLSHIDSMTKRTRRDHDTLDGYVTALQGRIAAMTRTHHRLATTDWAGVDLTSLVQDQLEPYRAGGSVTCLGPPIVLGPELAQAVSLTLHELTTNAAKYGGLAGADGSLRLSWSIEDTQCGGGRLTIVWKEHVTTPVSPPQREGFGLSQIRNMLRYEHRAIVDLTFEGDGLKCSMKIPLNRNKPGTLDDVPAANAAASASWGGEIAPFGAASPPGCAD